MALPFFADVASADRVHPTRADRLGADARVDRASATPHSGWLACQVWTDDVHNGKLIESVRLWDSNGDLVAQGQQLGCLITSSVGG